MENMPQVGQGATEFLPQDRWGYVVTKVSKTGRKITLNRLETPSLSTGHQPEGNCNGFPVWDHTYTDEELQTMRRDGDVYAFYSDKRGGFTIGGYAPVSVGFARYYRNFAD